jgi:hypothetical protein
MKKITKGLVLLMMSGISHSATMSSATYTIYDDTGQIVPFDTSPVAPVSGSIGAGVWSISSIPTFLGSASTTHSGTTFGPGSYSIDTIDGGIYSFTVDAGQLGGHILWDWSASTDIDIVNVWDVWTLFGETSYTSTDIDGDGIPGIGFIDGPFATIPFSANFDFSTTVPIPAAIWLFGSGLVGLIGVARLKKARI